MPLELVERDARESAEKQRYMERKVHSFVENGFLENGETMNAVWFLYLFLSD